MARGRKSTLLRKLTGSVLLNQSFWDKTKTRQSMEKVEISPSYMWQKNKQHINPQFDFWTILQWDAEGYCSIKYLILHWVRGGESFMSVHPIDAGKRTWYKSCPALHKKQDLGSDLASFWKQIIWENSRSVQDWDNLGFRDFGSVL